MCHFVLGCEQWCQMWKGEQNCIGGQTCPDTDDYADSKVDNLKGSKEVTGVNGGVDSFHQHAIRIDDEVDDSPGK